MEFKVDRKQFLNSLKPIMAATDEKSPLPVLANIYFKRLGGELCISATDLVLSVSTVLEIPVKATDVEYFTVPAKALMTTLSKLKSTHFNIKVADGGRALISSGRTRITLTGSPGHDYPGVPSYRNVDFYDIDSEALKQCLTCSMYAGCDDQIRYQLNSCYVEFKKDCIVSVGTDGHRMSIVKAPVACPELPGKIIPKPCVGAFIRALDGPEKKAKFGFNDEYLFLVVNGYVLSAKAIDSVYPDYTAAVVDHVNTVTVPRELLKDAMVLASYINPDYVTLDITEKCLTVSSKQEPMGSFSENIIPVNQEGGVNNSVYEPKFFIEYLSKSKETNVLIRYGISSLDPLLLEGMGGNYIGIIMPRQIKSR